MVQHVEPPLDLDSIPESPSPESPEFGQVHVIVTPPVPSIHTPEFGQGTSVAEPAGSPKFGFTVPASPNFGVQSPGASSDTKPRAPRLQEPDERQVGLGEPHPSTPEFGSLNNAPLLEDKLSSAASSPHGSSHENSPENAERSKRLSVDMLLPSPASPNGVSLSKEFSEFPKTGEQVDKGARQDTSKGRRFDFQVAEEQNDSHGKDGSENPEDENEKEELFQECIYMQRELKRRDDMLKWFYEELEATSAESFARNQLVMNFPRSSRIRILS